jgi:hypothetical protein
VVDFYCYSYRRFVPLRDFVGLLSLEGTESRIACSTQTPSPSSVFIVNKYAWLFTWIHFEDSLRLSIKKDIR